MTITRSKITDQQLTSGQSMMYDYSAFAVELRCERVYLWRVNIIAGESVFFMCFRENVQVTYKKQLWSY